MATRHQRVCDFLDCARDMWADGRLGDVRGFPVPIAPIPIIVGVNSEALARLAAIHTDGINVRSNHPRLDEIVAAAREARPPGSPPLLVTTWSVFSEELLDPDSAERQRYARLGIDRLVVVQFDRAKLDLIRR